MYSRLNLFGLSIFISRRDSDKVVRKIEVCIVYLFGWEIWGKFKAGIWNGWIMIFFLDWKLEEF
jgi:hypothetical protein